MLLQGLFLKYIDAKSNNDAKHKNKNYIAKCPLYRCNEIKIFLFSLTLITLFCIVSY